MGCAGVICARDRPHRARKWGASRSQIERRRQFRGARSPAKNINADRLVTVPTNVNATAVVYCGLPRPFAEEPVAHPGDRPVVIGEDRVDAPLEEAARLFGVVAPEDVAEDTFRVGALDHFGADHRLEALIPLLGSAACKTRTP